MEVESSNYIYKIQVINRARKIPSVNYLWDKSTEVYGCLKETNVLVHWAFNTVENVFNTMIEKSLPIAKLIERPINTIDKTLCQGLDYIEVKLPIIKEEPEQIINQTKSLMSVHLRPAVKTFTDLKHETKHKVKVMKLHTYCKVHYLRMYSWQQADKVMSTETGINILKTIDSTTDFIELILDKYLPIPYDFDTNVSEKLCNEDAKLHHTVGRLSKFSSHISKRIYFALMELEHIYRMEIRLLISDIICILLLLKYIIYGS
ncbi:lipid storage droplets surface-binding protein 2-like [Apis laboriosa]|uniref:lipid storage droplets surface-binding protein 2-like n=1 Tax=Apis laboriosa TaxID=183418 RepID=UPI001CC7A299|nr:lipid storage droplets surface-binding protein 2-like [Apis laboriosa]